jgi:hypothetical protein
MLKLNTFGWISLIVLLIGGLNLGLVGFFDYNLVRAMFGEMSVVTRIIYCLVGLAGLYIIFEGVLSRREIRTHRVRPA